MSSRQSSVFKNAFHGMSGFLKRTARFDDLLAKSIPIERGDVGYLVGVSELQAADGAFRKELSLADTSACFRIGQSWAKVQDETVFRQTTLNDENYILFSVDDRFGKSIGFVGLRAFEPFQNELKIVDLVLKSEDARATFSSALRTLAIWAEENLGALKMAVSLEASLSAPQIDLVAGLLAQSGFQKKMSSGVEQAALWQFTHDADRAGSTDILTAGPLISNKEASYALDATRYGWGSEWNKYIKKFDQHFAGYIGTKYALETSSCTGALHIALKALGLGKGDEVIVPEITWVATASAIEYVGATPVFVEVEADSWCMDPKAFEAAITPRTKCVIPVHIYGHPANMEVIAPIARKHGLFIVEDAAPAIGAEINGRKVGTYGDFATFSFQGAKLLVTGEGGALVTSNEELYKRAYAIWDHGRTPGTFWINEIGLKYKMSNVQAAIGLAQIERVDEQIEAKRRIFSWYAEELQGVKGLELARESSWARSIYWMTSMVLDPTCGLTRDEFCARLKAKKIDTRPAFPAISGYPMWKSAGNPIAKRIGDWGINLPSGVCLKEHEVRYVARSIREVLEQQYSLRSSSDRNAQL